MIQIQARIWCNSKTDSIVWKEEDGLKRVLNPAERLFPLSGRMILTRGGSGLRESSIGLEC